jgi:hypothetical protein
VCMYVFNAIVLPERGQREYNRYYYVGAEGCLVFCWLLGHTACTCCCVGEVQCCSMLCWVVLDVLA